MKQIAQVIEFKKAIRPTLTYNSQDNSFLLSGELNTNLDKKRLSKDYQLSYMKILSDRISGGNDDEQTKKPISEKNGRGKRFSW